MTTSITGNPPNPPIATKSVISWILKNIVLCLLPFFIGALIRYVYLQKVSFQVFDPGELSLSVSILYILTMKSASRLTDEDLRESLTTVCIIGFVCFLILFGCHSFIKVHLESSSNFCIDNIKKLISEETQPEKLLSGISSITSNLNNPDTTKFNTIQSSVSSLITILALIALPLAVVFKFKYKLED